MVRMLPVAADHKRLLQEYLGRLVRHNQHNDCATHQSVQIRSCRTSIYTDAVRCLRIINMSKRLAGVLSRTSHVVPLQMVIATEPLLANITSEGFGSIIHHRGQ